MPEQPIPDDQEIPDSEESKKYAAKFNRMTLSLVEYASVNECVITPRGVDTYIDSFLDLGTCACDDKRRSCPCKQAKDEIQDAGHCECLLFWNNYRMYYDWFKQRID